MAKLSIQEKEQLIVGTILPCNNEIKKISQIMPKLNENLTRHNIYNFNMKQLFTEINPLMENVNIIPDNSVYVKNTRGNFFAYFQKVYDFLDGFEPNIQRTLNESFLVDQQMVNNPIQLNITTFKEDLKLIINDLAKKDDIVNLSPEILKIKTLANQPIFIYGYDICNNISLKKELFEKFKITTDNLLAICFDKSNKQLLFVTNNTHTMVVYDLKTDSFDLYSKLEEIPNKNLTIKNYFETLKELIHNNIVNIYVNINEFKFKMTDNLFFDTLRQQEIITRKQEMSVIKK